MILGHNISNTHLLDYVKVAKENNAKIFQLFLRSPQNYKIIPNKIEDLKQLCTDAQDSNIKIVVHSSYLINLCRPSDDYTLQKGIALVIQDLEESVKLKALGCIIHMGHNTCNMTYNDAYMTYIKHIKYILNNSNKQSTLILETGASCGNEVSTRLNELGNILNFLTDDEKKRVKFCIDTCHIFSAGYDLSDPEFVDILDLYIDNTLGWNNVVVIHLNDSKCHLYAKKDRHADINTGYINIEGLIHFVKICNKHTIPLVLETPQEKSTYKEQIKYIVDLI